MNIEQTAYEWISWDFSTFSHGRKHAIQVYNAKAFSIR